MFQHRLPITTIHGTIKATGMTLAAHMIILFERGLVDVDVLARALVG